MARLAGLLSLAFLLLCSLTGPSLAARTGQISDDMFYDRGWIYDRPSVPSDQVRGQDMFKTVPPMARSNADVFDRFKNVRNTYGRDDMFPHKRIGQVPVHLLRIDP